MVLRQHALRTTAAVSAESLERSSMRVSGEGFEGSILFKVLGETISPPGANSGVQGIWMNCIRE